MNIERLKLNYHHRKSAHHHLSSVSIISSDLEKNFVVGETWIREIENRFAPAPITGDEFELFRILYVVINLQKANATPKNRKEKMYYGVPALFPRLFMSKVCAILDEGVTMEQIGKYFNDEATVADLESFMEEPSLRNLCNKVRLA